MLQLRLSDDTVVEAVDSPTGRNRVVWQHVYDDMLASASRDFVADRLIEVFKIPSKLGRLAIVYVVLGFVPGGADSSPEVATAFFPPGKSRVTHHRQPSGPNPLPPRVGPPPMRPRTPCGVRELEPP
jgi:hypothetical protein